MSAFSGKQSSFALDAPAIAGQCLIGAHNPMAGHQQTERIACAGASHGSGVTAQICGQFAVAHGLAGWNGLQGLPDTLLESAAAQIEWQVGAAKGVFQLRQHSL